MTTAARPTFEPARGRSKNDLSALSKQYSSKDLPAHTKLKYRQDGQGTEQETRSRDFRRDLEERERQSRDRRNRNRESSSSKRPRLDQVPAANLDVDDPVDDDDDDSDSDEEDDTAELLAELNKIKNERAQEHQKKEAERKAEEEKIRMENIIRGNPLLHQQEFKVKRRWDDDVVFKNCARGDSENKGFVNDTLRSEFHTKFMEKYVK